MSAKKRWLHPFICPHCSQQILVEVGKETPTECPHCQKSVAPVTPIEKKVLEYEAKYKKR
jgi:DNA-directed RNA polymerase subunit RPC12/RpoP